MIHPRAELADLITALAKGLEKYETPSPEARACVESIVRDLRSEPTKEDRKTFLRVTKRLEQEQRHDAAPDN